MPPQLRPSETTYTPSRVMQILHRDCYILPAADSGDSGEPVEFSVQRTGINTRYATTDIAAAQQRAGMEQCRAYCAVIASASDHLERLDDAYSKLIECNFQPLDIGTVVNNTCHRLTRLPAVPSAFDKRGTTETFSKLDDAYFIHDSRKTWDNLKVVRFVDTNVIRLALQIEIAGDSWWGGVFTLFINTIFCLLNAALELPLVDQSHAEEFLILQAFLWASWQRAVMLHFSYSLGFQLRLGFDYGRNRDLAVDIVPSVQKAIRIGPAKPETPGYMCKWAFKLLRSDRAAVALDFRAFFERYEQILGHLPPRCIISTEGDSRQCEGDSPGSCTRFKGMKIEDQSAHASPCRGHGQCRKLFWNEHSYRSQRGARAVTLRVDDHDQLNYCTASNSTMTVTHVWSHGQGGRPEVPEDHGTGFNSCLHERYIKIAQRFGCNSYWMDTPCIPQNHELRKEAIQNINSVFTSSKLTLVCDRDLMDIDVSNPTTELLESLLTVLLVCDWSVRAWTFLEANRGRNNIHLLCKNDQVVSLKEVLDTVHREGDITIATLLLTAQHLMPAQGIPPGGTPSEALTRRARGFVSIHEASCLLSHRHASRENDEVIIWSLLCGDEVKETAVDLWRSMIGRGIPTGFLMSNHPRIGYEIKAHRGFGWAPRRPDMPDDTSGKEKKAFFADDGSKSTFGVIKPGGLCARWLVSEFRATSRLWQVFAELAQRLMWTQRRKLSHTDRELQCIATQYLATYQWGALLQPGEAPLADVPVQYRGDSDGTLVAVIGSNDKNTWYWVCIYEWKVSIPLPSFRRKEILLV